MNFLDLFASTEWRELAQYRAINEAHASANRAGFDASLGLEQAQKLAAENAAMRNELVRLQLTLAATFDALAAQGLIDRDRLARDVEERLAAHRTAQAAAAQMTVCGSCRRQVQKARTRLTGSGAICDSCAANLEE